MLKLEKARKSDEIHIGIRQKAPFFNRIFCLALLWAVGIHLFGLFVFYVAPFKILYNDSLFLPVAVASDLGFPSDGNTLALLDEEVIIPSYLLLPPSMDLNPPKIITQKPAKRLEYAAPQPKTHHPFLASEQQHLPHYQVPIGPSTTPHQKIQVSGSLAQFQQQPEMPLPPFPLKLHKREHVLAFNVVMDGKTGKIIWLQPQDKYNPQVAQWGEEVIKDMQFNPTPADVSVSGQITLFLLSPGQDETL